MIKLYNSASRKLEIFKPLNPKEVKIYVCGITPYDASHLGHAFVFTIFDTLIRFLKFKGYGVSYVQNITDVDDDILKKAKEINENWQNLGNLWVKDLLADFDFINIVKPDVMPRASEVIDLIIQIIKSLEAKKITYTVDGIVYFSVADFKRYGKLSRLTPEQMVKISSIRGNDIKDPNKKNPLDFVLWQKSITNEPFWPSPWGQGRPGWHIECTAMNLKYLGSQIDIHGGGSDLIFPHHDSEIAQSESYTGKKPFVKYWLHCGMVLYESEKMSKSLGNLVFIKDLKKKYSANAIRWLLLSNHYRRPWEYIEEDLKDCQKIVDRFQRLIPRFPAPVGALPRSASSPTASDAVKPGRNGESQVAIKRASSLEAFMNTLALDFNTSKALWILKNESDVDQKKAMWNLLGFR
ncbi:cysteine--tRNA ligase [Candidatus Roizmanbacteria bacterium RIFCSPHIGHO2_02_FULL_37_13b]|uniref:Cysteine--tRNA ligase n=1 Tax=Candidatus Roizmanbacteria bacterium RIFCSPLOWO2_02_FULL_36_11 TaxID=1802071 RepID=A0A1F7JIQ0_9BACT|nr:MAG: cysteine--tRNA ligase [Candidatus Roizmanbacteria bacterium RIFCSPHIGHO2_02_FULL_37_13b]OGK55504.1 MAG: cysteine--tRNA ligase [Candidatus Roizmanbacteria bacterium RIFCSPLOWO2_02_FULL_36_11]